MVKTWSTHDRAEAGTTSNSRYTILVLALLSIALTVVPFGRLLGLPLVLLSTFFHEIGHGLVALVIGCEFHELNLWSDGSGLATILGAGSKTSSALVSAGGLLGPPIAAAVAFLAAKRVWTSRLFLSFLGIGFIVLGILFVRNLFGLLFIGFFAAIFILLAVYNRPWLMQTTLAFIGVQLSISVFSRMDYLFSQKAITAQGIVPSDVEAIAQALFLPYWFWGAVCGVLSVFVLFLGLWFYLKK